MTASLTYWASVVAVLLAWHAIAARYWHTIFARAVVASAERAPEGYRMGSLVLWRLPVGACLVEIGLSIAVLGVAPATTGGVRTTWLVLGTGIASGAWLLLPPGMRGTIPVDGGSLVLERRRIRALAVLFLFGLPVAATLGAFVAHAFG
jgi:hypothetical protein